MTLTNQHRSTGSRHPAARLLAAACSLTLASAAFALAAAAPGIAADTGPGATLELVSGAATVHAGGHAWTLRVSAGGEFLDASLTTKALGAKASTGGTEAHTWDLQMPAKDLTVNAKAGTLRLRTGTGLKPAAELTLNFRRRTSRNEDLCKKGTGTVLLFTGKLSGVVKLGAGHGYIGGKVHFAGSNFATITPATCVAKGGGHPGNPCSPGLFWFAGGRAGLPLADGSTVGSARTETLVLSRQHKFSVPRGGLRFDEIFASGPAPHFSVKTGKLTVTGSGPIVGSLAMTGKGKSTFPESCTRHHKAISETVTSYPMASFARGKTLHAREILFGSLKLVPKNGSIDFTKLG